MMTFLKVEETFNGTKSEEKRLAEENRVTEDVEAVERALAEKKVREATMLVQKALQEEALQAEAEAAMRGRPAIVSVVGEERMSIRAGREEEPVYIYYNSAATLSQSLLLVGVTAAALLALRV